MEGSTTSTSPTKPSAASRAMAVIMLASSPDRPTASEPWHVHGGDDLAVDLADEHHAGDLERLGVGDAHAVAELRHLARAGAISSPIWGPPPWTTTGSIPTERMSTTSSANDAKASPASSAAPSHRPVDRRQGVAAVLDDDDLPPEAQDVGQRLDEDRGALASG